MQLAREASIVISFIITTDKIMAKQGKTYWIADLRQIVALASPLRQEIVDVVESGGPCSIAQIASALGYPPDRLYFHIRRLETVGLLLRRGQSGSGRSAAAIYDVPGRPLRVRYDRRDKKAMRSVAAVQDGLLRLARRDMRRAMTSPQSIVTGPLRDTWAGRARGWLTPAQLRRLNHLVEEMSALVRSGTLREGTKPVAFTFVTAPPRSNGRHGKQKGVCK